MSKEELISELFLYLAQNDWAKIRQFDFRSSFMTWISVVATRFFRKKRAVLLEIELPETLISYMREEREILIDESERKELLATVRSMENPRYRNVIELLDIQDKEPKDVAQQLGITVANLYNLHRRALISLKTLYTS